MRRTFRPYGSGVTSSRLFPLLIALGILGLLYDRLGDPATWKFLVDRGTSQQEEEQVVLQEAPTAPKAATRKTAARSAAPAPASDDVTPPADALHPDAPASDSQATVSAPPPPAEVLIDAPNDTDPDAWEKFERLVHRIADEKELKSSEMGAYWRLMEWCQTEPLADMEKRAKRDVPFTKIYQEPDDYRGELIKLRLHVRRVIVHRTPETNPLGLMEVYECWGWTDDSLSYPYLVVLPKLPPGLPVGTDVRAEMVFTGYFLKVMKYQAFETERGAPLLIGRGRVVAAKAPAKSFESKSTPAIMFVILLAGVAVAGYYLLNTIRGKHRQRPAAIARSLGLDSDLPPDFGRPERDDDRDSDDRLPPPPFPPFVGQHSSPPHSGHSS